MRRKKLPESGKEFIGRMRELEERLFPFRLHEENLSFMKSDGRHFWHFRPSHHFSTGLITQEEIALLSEPDRRLLSVGAFPGYLEQVLVELGVPHENILLADKDPAIEHCSGLHAVVFDLHQHWPEMGTFDRIIFPESLCISIADTLRERGFVAHAGMADSGVHEQDRLETELLTSVMRQALRRLRPGGIIRANGPLSHPNVIRAMSAVLQLQGYAHSLKTCRFYLQITVC